MADTAAHLVERVLPEVPIRQWVLTLPYPLRLPCAWDAKPTSAVLRAFLRSVFADQRRRAKQVHGARSGQCAAVTFIQRFGSALNPTPHFHSLVLDGVYPGPAHAPGPFLPLPPPETEDVARVMAGTARRVMRLVESRGQRDDPEDWAAEGDPLLATLMAASIQSRIAAGQRWRRLGDRVEPADEDGTQEPPPRCVREGGMSLHADVAVPARDRKRLERLCRYVARPPIAIDRLEALSDGRLAYPARRLEQANSTGCSNEAVPSSAESSQRSVDGKSSPNHGLRTERATTHAATAAHAEPVAATRRRRCPPGAPCGQTSCSGSSRWRASFAGQALVNRRFTGMPCAARAPADACACSPRSRRSTSRGGSSPA